MEELKFQKLTPTQEVDLSGYEDAFHYIFAENDIRNIAISGAYSSGKSSVIESYKKKHPEKKFLHLSLAHFQAIEEEPAERNDQENEEKKDDLKKLETIIEGKILNQLIQQIPAEKIPQTNFRIKRSMDWKMPTFASVMLCIFIALFLHCTRFDAWKSMIDTLRDGCIKSILSLTTTAGAQLCSLIVMLAIVGFAVFKIIKVQHSKNILRKISVQGNEIEIFADNNDSYFDKYLNEVLYLFENTNVDGIVFEDIDRFDNHTIFERLREINTLTNIRLNNKKGRNIKKPLRFFYLLRDDIFENKDRTKFFDYIMLVVPVLDSSNSYNKIKEYLESADLFEQFDDHFLRGISLYIDDLRLVKNIFNEFLIYNKKLNSIELDANKLFAIIVYKNIFPKDFADLQLNQGFVHTLFESREQLIADQITTLQKEVSVIEDRISYYNSEHLESQKELETVKREKENETRYNWQRQNEYQEWLKNIYPKRMQALEDRKAENIFHLTDQLQQKKQEIENVSNLPFAAILNRDNISDAFRVEYVNEIEQTERFNSIKANPYFALLKYLISRGYIDESYSDYMTFFYPNSLSLNDKVFLRSVADRIGKPATYTIDSPALVTENLNEYDFSQKETLNYALSEYILTAQKNVYVQSMVAQMESAKSFEYLSGYMRNSKAVVPMVVAIDKYWPTMFREALKPHTLPEDLLKTFSYLSLLNVDIETLKSMNIDGCLRDYISRDPRYLCVSNVDAETLGKAFEALEVSFTNIDSEGINDELFDYVYQHNLYDINNGNISLMLIAKCGVKEVIKVLPTLLTFLQSHQEYALYTFLWSELEQTLPVYFDMYTGGIQDDSKTIIEILNTDGLDYGLKRTYVERLETCIDTLEKVVDSDDQKLVIAYKKARYSPENILFFFTKYGLTEDLISFINSDSCMLDYVGVSQAEILNKFLDACMRAESINDEKYLQIMDNICERMPTFTVKGLNNAKLNILIRLCLIEMNLTNLKFIRANYPDSVLPFIEHDIESYISIVTENGFDINETKRVLEFKDASDQQKIELLKQTREAVETKHKNFSDELLTYIFRNNLYEGDLPWILSNYSNYSEAVKSIILQIVKERIVNITSNYSDEIDTPLLVQIFKSRELDFPAKVNLLGKTAKTMEKDTLCSVLADLEADKIADNIRGGKKRVKVTNENELILRALLKAEVIFDYNTGTDGQYYKTIKYRAKTKNESLPASLL